MLAIHHRFDPSHLYDALFATIDGVVSFRTRSGGKVEVNVLPAPALAAE